MSHAIRKLVTYFEDVFIEGGKAGAPVRTGAVAAVISNPWSEQGFVEDLQADILGDRRAAPPQDWRSL